MKQNIEKRLNQHVEELINKDELSMEEINFLVFWLNRIEMKENELANKKIREESNQKWRENMLGMIDTLAQGGN